MRFKLRFSTRAAAEMEAVLDYTLVHFGRTQFVEYTDLIREAFDQISRNPYGASARSRPELGADVFSFHISRRGRRARHLFLYRVSEGSEGAVHLLRFLHDSMEPRIQEWDEI